MMKYFLQSIILYNFVIVNKHIIVQFKSNNLKFTVMEKKLNEKEMQEFVNENKLIVPKNQKTKFETLSLEKQVSKLKFYQDMIKLKADAMEKNRIINRVKDIFDKRHATVSDAKDVIEFCQEFINNFKQKRLDEIDEKIKELQLMKESL